MEQMRFNKLDVVRGVAAFVVVLNHAYNFTPGHDWHDWKLDYTPLSHLVNGRVAVIVFFVLSGFVLALPFLKGQRISYGRFVFRRFCRIYLPFAVAIVLALGLASMLAFPKPQWAAAEADWASPIDLPLILAHFLMTGIGYASISLDPPMWTLIQEMRIALVFPLLALAVMRLSWKGVAVTFLIAVMATKTPALIGEPFGDKVSSSALGSLLLTAYYLYFFAFGVLLAKNLDHVIALVKKMPRSLHLAIIAGFILAPKALVEKSYLIGDLTYALVAGYIIICCIAFPLQTAVLDRPSLRWAGKVSYSLYLTHLPVMLALMYLLRDRAPLPVILVLSLALMLPVAEIFHRNVELPSMRLGRLTVRRKPVPPGGAAPA
ncbi:acyltransferase [Mesorhizobium sp. VK25A]|uniref:Acyltransferase n=1 Tax=Mesorhizobium vachelliae TaxID=3072309 RepID=A0ABU5AAF7_9HYPH|nr:MULTISPECIES: acyltransferase [unclassified Mesorhizobium]MDX8534696.1 acyltransferase [Mesorhizobium sp. VK25D]MDX8547421.1 acyltransferase [Mesorhizobium sp. VK25A]